MHLAVMDLFRAKWTSEIHEEWITNLLSSRSDLTRAQLDRTRELMDKHVRDCIVEDYEDLIDGLTLPDPNDRHVLAAAIRGRCDVIVTYNLKDFPERELKVFGLEAQHPDVFITHLIDLSSAAVCIAVERHRLSLKNPPKSVDEYLRTLEQQGLSTTVRRLRDYSEIL